MSKNFTVTCNLLSQYIKENGRSLADLALIGKNDTYRAPTTMSLLPGVDVLDRNDTKSMDLFPQRAGFDLQNPPAVKNREAEKSPLTMFYGGKVLIFDDFPADKARDLMMLAGKGSGLAPSAKPPATVAPAAKPPATVQDIPIARKASLHRFLEKRKDRINAKAPYQGKKGASSPVANPKVEENQSWLGLNRA